MKPKLITTSARVVTADNRATAAQCKAYRTGRRITLTEVAAKLTTPQGIRMTKANLWQYESGAQQWTADLVAAYVAAVDAKVVELLR